MFFRLHDLSSPDYRLYDMCSSCEVYDSLVKDSKYFHFFIGKNFLFASVVAYRRLVRRVNFVRRDVLIPCPVVGVLNRYQVTLLGVKPKDSRDILLNPGLHYILQEDDVCYYIGFTREEYSKVRETPPSPVRMAIWQTCANLALLSLSLAGISTEQLGVELGAEPGEEEEGKSEEERLTSDVTDCFSEGGVEEEEEGVEPQMSCPTSNEPSSCELPLPEDTCPIVKRGLKLLRFHSKIDVHANPVVKVNFCTPTPVPTPEEETDESTFDLRPPKLCPDDARLVEEGRIIRPQFNPIVEALPVGRRRRSLRRSMSESSLTGVMGDSQANLKKHGIIYSSQLSLMEGQGSKVDETSGRGGHAHIFPPLARVLRRMSSWNNQRSLPFGTVVDFEGSQEVSRPET